jgi:hypothetical protein
MVVVTLALTVAAVLVLALVARVVAARGRRSRDGSGDRSVTGHDR